MERIQRQHTSRHNRALQANKVPLRLNQMAAPALTQLSNTIHTPRENAQRRKDQRNQEPSESFAGSQLRMHRIQRALSAQLLHGEIRPHRKVCGQHNENQQREDLHAQPRQHDVIARLRIGALVGGSAGHAAAERLENQGEEVAGDEDLRVALGLEARVLRAEGAYDAAEAEV